MLGQGAEGPRGWRLEPREHCRQGGAKQCRSVRRRLQKPRVGSAAGARQACHCQGASHVIGDGAGATGGIRRGRHSA